jgi:nucleoid DNA-binding protein
MAKKTVTIKKDTIIGLIKDKFELSSKKEAEELLEKLDKVIETVKLSLKVDEKANIGKYLVAEKKHIEAKHTDAKIGRNPRTGEPVDIKEKDIPAHDEIKIKSTKALNK